MIGRRLQRGWLVRIGRVGAWYVAVTHAALVVWLERGAIGTDVSALVVRAVTWMTVAAGIVAVGMTVDVTPALSADGVDALLRRRGFSKTERALATLAATTSLVTRAILWPALALSLVTLGTSHAFAEVVARTLRLVAVVGYCPIAGLLLSVLSRWAVALAPARPRLLFLGLVGVPHAVVVATGEGTSVLQVLGELLGRVGAVAGGIG